MKNKEKFKKIANIISKVLLALLIVFIVLVLCLALFRSCKSCSIAKQDVAYASETDGLGRWMWNKDLSINGSLQWYFDFSFTSNGELFVNCYNELTADGLSSIYYLNYSPENDILVYDADSHTWVNESYRIIDIKTAPPAEFLTILQANAVFQGGSEPVSYSLFVDISNGVKQNLTVNSDETKTIQIQPNSGYTYPTSVSVTGCTLDSYNSETGVAVISNATGNCRIAGDCVAIPVVETYTLFLDITYGAKSQTAIKSNESLNFQIVPDTGYTYPTSVSVINCTLVSYNSSTGSGVVSNATGNCRVSGVCPLSSTSFAVRGRYTFINTLTGGGSSSVHQAVNFTTSNNGVISSWSGIDFSSDLVSYNRLGTSGSSGGTPVYSSSAVGSLRLGWQSPQYQVIDFGSNFQSVSEQFYNWLIANTVPADVVNSESYQIGYNAGLAVGQESGYSSGYAVGEHEGYNRGYEIGKAEGQNAPLSGASGIIAGTSHLFEMNIFGNFSILDCFLVVFGIGCAIWFLKMFAGG